MLSIFFWVRVNVGYFWVIAIILNREIIEEENLSILFNLFLMVVKYFCSFLSQLQISCQIILFHDKTPTHTQILIVTRSQNKNLFQSVITEA